MAVAPWQERLVLLLVFPHWLAAVLPSLYGICDALGRAGKSTDSTSFILGNVRKFFAGFLTTLRFKPFLKLCLAIFLVFNGFILIASFQSYVIIYYVFWWRPRYGRCIRGPFRITWRFLNAVRHRSCDLARNPDRQTTSVLYNDWHFNGGLLSEVGLL